MNAARAITVLGEYAADQWGLVTTAQAVAAGVDTTTLTRLAAAGSLVSVLRGVHQLAGAQQTRFVTEAAAWLRLDPAAPAWQREPLDINGGVISHRSAASIHQIGDLLAPHVEISVPRRRRSRDASVRFHRADLRVEDITIIDGLLPVTSIERTVADLLSEHMDGGHAADLLTDTLNDHQVDRGRLAALLASLAERYGALPGDGRALIEFLTRLLPENHPTSAEADTTATASISGALQQWEQLSPHVAEAETVAAKLSAFQADNDRKTTA